MHIGMISTYPPTQCGIATYSSYLVSKLEALNPPATVDVISPCGDGEDDSFSLSRADGSDLSERLFNTVVKLKPDVVHIQHEYGLYDPSRGLAITPLLYRLRAQGIPVVATLHSVYETFSEYQKLVWEISVTPQMPLSSMRSIKGRALPEPFLPSITCT